LYVYYIAKNRGFPPVYKIERVAKMSAKRAFFSIFQKLTLFCCAMFFGITHAFSANLPSGYTELEYIGTNHNAYIMTNFTVNDFDRVVADIKLYDNDTELNSKQYPHLFGVSADASSGGVQAKVFRFFNPSVSSMYGAYNDKWASTWGGTWAPQSVPLNKWHKFDIKLAAGEQYIKMDTSVIATGTMSSTLVNSYKLPIFAMSYAGNIMYFPHLDSKEIKMYLGNTLVANFVPAKNSSGVVGMYDTVGGQFYTSRGTGEFTGGRAVCSNGELAQTYTSATGTVTQSGTPTPTNPIEPTFYQQGYLVLRKINDTYADSYDATTGKITRRVGVKVLNGTEDWFMSGNNYLSAMYNILINDMYAEASSVSSNRASPYSTHFGRSTSWLSYDVNARLNKVQAYTTTDNSKHILGLGYPGASEANIPTFKQWLAQQYAAGTPVVVYYPLVTPVEENWAPEQCLNGIKIATTAYNTARFSPVVNDLNSTIATIRSVVTNTINQTKAIADLQAKKQTRPDEQCPAGKKCLLVEDNNGTPHWYEIIENIYGLPAGYTPLEYIRSSGVAYIDTGYSPTSKTRIELVAKMDSGAGNVNIAGSAISSSSGSSSDALLVINSYTDTEYEIKFGPSGTWVHNPTNMTTKNTFSLSATEFRVNDVVKETYSGSVPDTGNKPFYLFQRWRSEITSTNSKVQIYEFNIYENGTLVRRMVPAKQGTTVGMYDTIGNRFYTKSGTGSLTAGPEI
jgi:hypothetical protein